MTIHTELPVRVTAITPVGDAVKRFRMERIDGGPMPVFSGGAQPYLRSVSDRDPSGTVRQQRAPSEVDAPDRPAGELYCRVPQDSALNVRGVRNIPCETNPGKRAPTVEMCESDEQYVPLNDGYNWKGDPNATYSGQPIPQYPPGINAPGEPPPALVPYDPATGNYIGPDGRPHTQGDLVVDGPQTWQSMLVPPN